MLKISLLRKWLITFTNGHNDAISQSSLSSQSNLPRSLPLKYPKAQEAKSIQALSTLTVGHLRKSRDAISDSGGKTLLC
jgi:hypothetical protein